MSAVVFVLQRPDGQVLLEYRPRGDQFFPDQWVFPGGKVKPSEYPHLAMLREVKEELGVTPLGTEHLELPGLKYAEPGQTDAYLVDVYLIRHWDGLLPNRILDTGHYLAWWPLSLLLENSAGCVAPVSRAVTQIPRPVA